MKRIIFILLVLFLLVSAGYLWADRVNIPVQLIWSRVNPQTIVIYENDAPIAQVEFYYVHIYRNSSVMFFDLSIGPGSKVLVDGKVYDVKKVKTL